jgi:hypothetical protein
MRFEILPGLPSCGPPAIYFIEQGRYREGLVVRFYPNQSEPWVGNFLGGLTKYNAVIDHPNGTDIIVIAQGDACVIDVENRKIRHHVASQVEQVIRIPALGMVVIQNLINLIAITFDGSGWQSERISWDGFRNLKVCGTELLGEAYTPLGDAWMPFKLDLLTGHCLDAVYQRDIAGAVEIIPKAE